MANAIIPMISRNRDWVIVSGVRDQSLGGVGELEVLAYDRDFLPMKDQYNKGGNKHGDRQGKEAAVIGLSIDHEDHAQDS